MIIIACLNLLVLALYGWKGNHNLIGLSQSASCELLITDFGLRNLDNLSWSVDLQVTNFVESMK